jgi:hypothetical protein
MPDGGKTSHPDGSVSSIIFIALATFVTLALTGNIDDAIDVLFSLV